MTDDNFDPEKIILSSEYLKKYDYLKKIYKFFKNTDNSFDEKNDAFKTYITNRNSLNFIGKQKAVLISDGGAGDLLSATDLLRYNEGRDRGKIIII